MDKFIVDTSNFVTHAMSCKALKAADNNIITHDLYKKASMHGGKIIISDLESLIAWRDALKAYKPANATEGKIYRVLIARAVRGCNKRSGGIVALSREN